MLSSLERTIACWLLAGVILAGFLFPVLSEVLAPFRQTSLLFLIIMSLLPLGRLEVSQVFSVDSKVWQIVIWQLLVLPAIILSAAHLARIDQELTVLMVATAAAGSLFASPTFAELLSVNKQRALQCMILSTFLMPFSYYFFFKLVLQTQVTLDVYSLIQRCMTFLGIPLGLLLVYMGIAEELPIKIANTIEGFSRRSTIIALILFGLGIIGPATELLHNDPHRFILYLLIVTTLGTGMAYLTAVVMFRQGISDAVTASIVSGFRNVGLGFVLLSSTASHATAEYVGVSQIPIFLAPLLLNIFMSSPRKTKAASVSELEQATSLA